MTVCCFTQFTCLLKNAEDKGKKFSSFMPRTAIHYVLSAGFRYAAGRPVYRPRKNPITSKEHRTSLNIKQASLSARALTVRLHIALFRPRTRDKAILNHWSEKRHLTANCSANCIQHMAAVWSAYDSSVWRNVILLPRVGYDCTWHIILSLSIR